MRNLLLIFAIVLTTACGSPDPQGEPAMTPAARTTLIALKAQPKFRPELLKGYVGADTQEDAAPLNAAVNELIDEVLKRPDGPVSEAEVQPLVNAAILAVDYFATEDRERAYRYFDQVWRTLGLRGDPIRQAS